MRYKVMCLQCGHVAFVVNRDLPPAFGDLMLAATATLLDGAKPKQGTLITCGTCGRFPYPSPVRLQADDAAQE
jgi:ribosomal protein L37E